MWSTLPLNALITFLFSWLTHLWTVSPLLSHLSDILTLSLLTMTPNWFLKGKVLFFWLFFFYFFSQENHFLPFFVMMWPSCGELVRVSFLRSFDKDFFSFLISESLSISRWPYRCLSRKKENVTFLQRNDTFFPINVKIKYIPLTYIFGTLSNFR